MPQTKRRRKTKHRGNAAGIVEARGRTGRKPTEAEKKGPQRGSDRSQQPKVDRLDKPPTWKGAVLKSMAAAVVMLLLGILLTGKPQQIIALFPIVLVLYVPLSYYTDSFLYKRRQRQKSLAAEKAKAQRATERAGAAKLDDAAKPASVATDQAEVATDQAEVATNAASNQDDVAPEQAEVATNETSDAAGRADAAEKASSQ
jgi:hypothetical protein